MTRRRREFGWLQRTGPTWSVRWWEGGKMRRKRGFATQQAAQEFLAMRRVAIRSGGAVSDVTLKAVGTEWLTEHSAVRLRSHQDNVERWGRVMAYFGPKTLIRDVTAQAIATMRSRLVGAGLRPGTVNRHLALLRTVLNYAEARQYVQQSPVRRFARGSYLLPDPKPKLPPPLKDAAEAVKLLEAVREVEPSLYALFAFLLLTGARRGEAAGLRWEDIDWGRRLVRLQRSYDAPTKSGEARTVPLSAELVAILTEHQDRYQVVGDFLSSYVFVGARGKPLSPGTALPDVLETACERAGLSRMRIHDLRHAYASLWLMGGGSIADLQRNLGHSTPVLTTETYGHLAEEHRAREADSRLRLGLTKPRPRKR